MTYLSFIFMQDTLLGVAAVMMYPLQMYVIPKLQRKINALAKQRVRTVRRFSDRVGETVAGITEIHAHDTSHYARALVANLLGKIFDIRFEIYRRKFFVKFLNNFLDKITPFFFYSVGGYFAIIGELSVGALVAALAAYKDISAPWKELLKYYQTKEDIRVKYTQVIEQFQPEGMLSEALLDREPEEIKPLTGALVSTNLSYAEDPATKVLDTVSFGFDLGKHVITVGLDNSGKGELGMLLARLIGPTGGRISIDEQNLAELPESVVGRRIAYVGQNAYIFAGTVRENLLYSLKRRPLRDPVYDEEEKLNRERELKAALKAKNSPLDLRADWVDYAAAGVANADELETKILETIRVAQIEDDVYQLGLRGTVVPDRYPVLAQRVLEARENLRIRLQDSGVQDLLEPFDRDLYNSNMTVAENLLFGSSRDPAFDPKNLSNNPDVREVLDNTNLTWDMVNIGKRVAETMIELFADVDPGSELFDRFSFISSEDLPEFRNLLVRAEQAGIGALVEEDRASLLALTLKLIPSQHRLGMIDDDIRTRLVAARKALAERLSQRHLQVEVFDRTRFNSAISVQDNILFGRPHPQRVKAQAQLREAISQIVDDMGLRDEIIKVGLDYEVGTGGSRLSLAVRQKLAIARCLIKNPDILIVNQATSALDATAERHVLHSMIDYRKNSSLIWISDRAEFAKHFDHVMVMDGGKLRQQGTYEELKNQGGLFPQLLPAA
ncbi:MAG: ABC transporter ATP-binding protein/permease [Gammaproteobacteria bacterium]|nr:ABC transporter ATP-binding protein/permease [Gammaproteobacteria bacterium]